MLVTKKNVQCAGFFVDGFPRVSLEFFQVVPKVRAMVDIAPSIKCQGLPRKTNRCEASAKGKTMGEFSLNQPEVTTKYVVSEMT